MNAMPNHRVTDAEAVHENMREAARELLAKGNGLQLQTAAGVLELRAGRSPALPFAEQRVLLEGPGCKLSLLLPRERGDSPLGDLRWHDYQGEARLLAWSLAQEELVAALSQLFGTTLLPTGFQTQPAEPPLWLELDWRDAAKRQLHGWLGLTREAVRPLLDAAEWKRDPRRISTIGHVDAVSLNLIVAGRALDAAAVAALAPGDVLVVGTQADCEGRLQPDRDKARDVFGLPDGWPVRWQQGQWVVAAPTALSAAAEASRPHFVVTSLTLSLEQIGALQPGSVAIAGASLIGCTVGIVLHGHRFGEGVLVGMGAWLGVRITNREDGRQDGRQDNRGEGQHGPR